MVKETLMGDAYQGRATGITIQSLIHSVSRQTFKKCHELQSDSLTRAPTLIIHSERLIRLYYLVRLAGKDGTTYTASFRCKL